MTHIIVLHFVIKEKNQFGFFYDTFCNDTWRFELHNHVLIHNVDFHMGLKISKQQANSIDNDIKNRHFFEDLSNELIYELFDCQ